MRKARFVLNSPHWNSNRGAGSDAFSIEVTDGIEEKRERLTPVRELIERNKVYVDYANYLKNRGAIKKE